MTTYRFKYSQQFVNEIADFARVHQYDDRHIFKEAWERWLYTNETSITNEINLLQDAGYEGDVYERMYFSARYYFRKKNVTVVAPKKRRDYISIDHDLIIIMDTHIRRVITTSNKPSIAYEQFCIEYENDINEESTRLLDLNVLNIHDINKKLKKTYKNRFYIINNRSA
tara:strand:+ start:135 stop:641 length:507 start_codon:yes stop_codon:yes gene_type:complete